MDTSSETVINRLGCQIKLFTKILFLMIACRIDVIIKTGCDAVSMYVCAIPDVLKDCTAFVFLKSA
jgi:hypothetical protein